MYDFNGDFETFFTGEIDSTKSGLYDTFRGSPNLPHWKGEHCSNIQDASDGTKFKSYINENDTLKFFRKSMCRPQRLVSLNCFITAVIYHDISKSYNPKALIHYACRLKLVRFFNFIVLLKFLFSRTSVCKLQLELRKHSAFLSNLI